MDSPPQDRDNYRRRSRSPGAERGGAPQGVSDGGKNPGNNLFVSGVSNRVQNDDLETLFSRYGALEKCTIVLDPHSKESRGFAFVTFQRAEDADAAIAGLNGTVLENRTLSVEKAKRARARTPTPGRYFGPPKSGPPRDDRRRYDDRRGGYDDRRGGDRDRDRDYRPERRDSRDRDRGYDRRDRSRDYDRRDDRRDDRGGRYDDRRRYADDRDRR